MTDTVNIAIGFRLRDDPIYLTKHSIKCDGTQCCECLGFIQTKFIFRAQDSDEEFDDGKRARKAPLLLFDRKRPQLIETYFEKINVERRIYSEVIPADIPRKIFVDVDDKKLAQAYPELVNNKNTRKWNKYQNLFAKLLETVYESIRDVVFYNYADADGMLEHNEMVFSTYYSNGWDENARRYKASAHVVLQNYYIDGVDHGKVFEREFKDKMTKVEHFEYDPKMNGQTNLRATLNHKIGSSRVKRVSDDDTYPEFKDSLITYTEGRKLIFPNGIDLFDPKRDYTHVDANVCMENLDVLCSRAKEAFCDYANWTRTCRKISDFTNHSAEGLALFDKWSKAHCPEKYVDGACEAEWAKYTDPPRDANSINISIHALLKFVERKLYVATRHMMFPEEDLRRAEEQKVLQLCENDDIEEFRFANNKMINVKTVNKKLLDGSIYESDKEFNTIAVRSGMATGKTVALVDGYLKSKLDVEGYRFLWISHRRSFTSQTVKKFDGKIVGYWDHTDVLTEDWLMVQVDSLFRIPEAKRKFDCVVVDEWIAFADHMCLSDYMRHSARIAFEQIMSSAKQLIVMDAQLDDDALKQVLCFRNLTIDVIFNKRLNTKPEYVMFDSDTLIMKKMIKKLQKGQRIVIPTTSKNTADIVKELLAKNGLKKKVFKYTGETDDKMAKKHFQNIEKYWSKADIVIYTPTCSEGVSFTGKRFDSVFGLFYDTSANVETARQMMHRVRNIATNKYYVYIKHIPGKKDDVNEENVRIAIKRTGKVFRNDNIEHQKNNGLIEPVSNGTVGSDFVYNETPWFKGYIYYCVRRLLSQTAYYERFITLAKQSGATVVRSKFKMGSKTTIDVKNTVKEIRRELKDGKLEHISQLDDLTPDVVRELNDKVNKTRDEKLQLAHRLPLRKAGFDGDITVDVLKKFKDPTGLVRTFKYVNLNTAKDDFDWCCKHYKFDHDTYTLTQATQNLMFRIHIALHLLKVCGFGEKKIRPKAVSEAKLVRALCSKANLDVLVGKSSNKGQMAIMVAFKKRRTYTRKEFAERTIKTWLEYVNPILRQTFDCSIKKVDRYSDRYTLQLTDKFGKGDDKIPFPITFRVDDMYGKERDKKIKEQLFADAGS